MVKRAKKMKGGTMEENPVIVIASKTLIDMCISLGLGKITQETFVGNLEIFAQTCRAAITAEQPAIPQQPLCGSPDGSTQMPKCVGCKFSHWECTGVFECNHDNGFRHFTKR